MSNNYLDISIPMTMGMLAWPTDPPFEIGPFKEIAKGAHSNVSWLRMSTHTGTHVDAPYHFAVGDTRADDLSLDKLIGPAEVIYLPGVERIDAVELEAAGADLQSRVLLKTDNSKWIKRGPIPNHAAYLTQEGAQFLVERRAVLVGIDGMSIDGAGESGAHLTLLQAGVVILETIDLSEVEPGQYELICLPLRLAADGSPTRTVLRYPICHSE